MDATQATWEDNIYPSYFPFILQEDHTGVVAKWSYLWARTFSRGGGCQTLMIMKLEPNAASTLCSNEVEEAGKLING
jgi:hypothetical protein